MCVVLFVCVDVLCPFFSDAPKRGKQPLQICSFLLFLSCLTGYPGYGYFPAAGAANGIGGGGGAVNGIGGGGAGGAGGTVVVNGGSNPGGNERNGSSQPSPATYYDYANGGAAVAAAAAAAYHHRASHHVDPASAMGNSPLLRDAYSGRSGSFTFKLLL